MGLFESCKEVKFSTMNTRAIEFIGGGAKNFRGKLNFSPLRHANKCTHATICMVVPLYAWLCHCICALVPLYKKIFVHVVYK